MPPLGSMADKRPITILANLPYVPNAYQINQAAHLEPRLAIFGGEDGLDLYWQMFAQIRDLDLHASLILAESMPFQHKDLEKIAQEFGYKQVTEEDFIQAFARKLPTKR